MKTQRAQYRHKTQGYVTVLCTLQVFYFSLDLKELTGILTTFKNPLKKLVIKLFFIMRKKHTVLKNSRNSLKKLQNNSYSKKKYLCAFIQ